MILMRRDVQERNGQNHYIVPTQRRLYLKKIEQLSNFDVPRKMQ